jgi:adenine-specific DNA-methyltransferase
MTTIDTPLLHHQIITDRFDQIGDFRFEGRSPDRVLGSYYTNPATTLAMADWIVRTPRDRILEPSFGDGSFVRAVNTVVEKKRFPGVQQFGIELVAEAYADVVRGKLLDPARAFHADFLTVKPFEVDALIGNPPYVRIRHLHKSQRDTAMAVAERVLGQPMDPSGSVWMPFVLHAMQFLARGGRMALVLPHEFTHVRYARPLWKKLGESFGRLQVVRIHQRVFGDILQNVVLFFADQFGESTPTVELHALENVFQLARFSARRGVSVTLNEIVNGYKAFVRALLPTDTIALLQRIADQTKPLRDICTFNIGYVTGDKKFFHPLPEIMRQYQLSPRNLKPAMTSSRQLAGSGLWTSRVEKDRLFLPNNPMRTDTQYILHGEQLGIHRRYKCKVRDPWYRVPGVKVPDLILSVFCERPILAINDEKLLASNSLLCGYLRGGTPKDFAAAWYTSLTLLQCELEIHALGGGVFVMVPGEVGNIQLPCANIPSSRHIKNIDRALRSRNVSAAYASGDQPILQRQLGISNDDLTAIHNGIATLRHWRTFPKPTF